MTTFLGGPTRNSSKLSRRPFFSIVVLLSLLLSPLLLQAKDDTGRFFGTWQAHILVNGQKITVISVHDSSGYKNFIRTPTGDTPAGEGTFSAANGIYKTSAPNPNQGGAYYFANNDTAVCTNSAGQIVTWRRIKAASDQPGSVDANVAAHGATGYNPPSERPGNQPISPGSSPSGGPPSGGASPNPFKPDPSLSPDINAAMEALNRKDSTTAWRDFTAAARRGDSYGEFGLGAMLYRHLNPPGTGYYAQCEKWLLAAANHDNVQGMEFLARYYYDSGVSIAGGINPGINNIPIPPALQSQAEGQFREARQWFQRASEKGDVYAMGNLAIMLDAGIGGPRDHSGAEEWRTRIKAGPDKVFARRATSDTSNLANTAAWQAGHYAEVVKNAQADASRGDANAQALLGRAYYLGVGVQRNYATAFFWLNKSVAQGNADAMFFLGLMYEHGYGVAQDIPRSVDLFDRAAAKGQGYARMEVKGMRMQGELNKAAAEMRARGGGVLDIACQTAGGVPATGECIKSGRSIDPFNAEQAAAP